MKVRLCGIKMWSKFLLLLLALTQVSCFKGNCIGGIQNVDGFVKAPDKFKAGLGEFPWVVALFKRGQVKPFCAGSLIQNDIVLTTAFCVQKYRSSLIRSLFNNTNTILIF